MHVNCRDFRLLCAFFFFKQKTAYELRISDWSSDVCSSDLASRVRRDIQAPVTVAVAAGAPATASPLATDMASAPAVLAEADSLAAATVTELFTTKPMQPRPWPRAILPGLPAQDAFTVRSEEHTSELQSLMRTSYAVFCLKNKNKH